MARKRYTTEQIIAKLREAEVALAQGDSVATVVRQLGVAEQTYYRWRREYGGLQVDQAKRLKELEKENQRLRRVVADQALDNAILKEVASATGPPPHPRSRRARQHACRSYCLSEPSLETWYKAGGAGQSGNCRAVFIGCAGSEAPVSGGGGSCSSVASNTSRASMSSIRRRGAGSLPAESG